MDVRIVCTDLLVKVLDEGKSLAKLLPAAAGQVSSQDLSLLAELSYGFCRWHFQLRSIASMLLKKPFREDDIELDVIVMLGIYQLKHTRIAPHAAISESVNLCRHYEKDWACPVVNAVLRNFQRQHEELDQQLASSAVPHYSHPKWFIKQLKRDWPESWEQICTNNNVHPPMTLRVNSAKISRDDYLQKLTDAGIEARAGLYSPCAITLSKACDAKGLPSFAEGEVSVQDEAAQLSASLLDLASGQRVLDACAAPGGKSCHILESQEGIDLSCVELEAGRIGRIEENLERLNLQAAIIQGDASKPELWWDGVPFDRILLDAPCSATGVIRRNPDIKLLRRREDIAQLAELQGRILRALWPTLAPGGRLVYATCSVMKAENSESVEAFLAEQEDAQHLEIEAEWGQACPAGRQLFPQEGGHDGFYYAVLLKDA